MLNNESAHFIISFGGREVFDGEGISIFFDAVYDGASPFREGVEKVTFGGLFITIFLRM